MFLTMTPHGLRAVSAEEILAAAEEIKSRRERKKVLRLCEIIPPANDPVHIGVHNHAYCYRCTERSSD